LSAVRNRLEASADVAGGRRNHIQQQAWEAIGEFSNIGTKDNAFLVWFVIEGPMAITIV
jgi:hypothetical protein